MTGSIQQRSETDLTYALKWAAHRWLYGQAGCRVIGFEVRLEGPSGRVADVVGVDNKNRVYLVEVKASKADFRKDHRTERDRKRLTENFAGLEDAARFASELAGLTHTNGSDAVELANSMKEAAQTRSEAAKKRVALFSTKFHSPAYLRAADFHYLMTPSGLIWPSDLPPFWGLLNEDAEIVVEAPPKQVRRVNAHVLRAIGKANTRDLMKACGVAVPRGETAESVAK